MIKNILVQNCVYYVLIENNIMPSLKITSLTYKVLQAIECHDNRPPKSPKFLNCKILSRHPIPSKSC